jgi:hypothetical protein
MGDGRSRPGAAPVDAGSGSVRDPADPVQFRNWILDENPKLTALTAIA